MTNHVEFEVRSVLDYLAGVGPQFPKTCARSVLQRGLNSLHLACAGKPYMPEGTGAAFHFKGYLSLSDSSSFFFEVNDETSIAKNHYRENLMNVSNTPCGAYEFFDSYVLGNQGLILDPARRVCWIGLPLGWEQHHLDMFMCQPGLFERTPDMTLRCEKSLLSKMDKASRQIREKSCAVLPIPGFRVYGHWLIDLIPRLADTKKWINNSRVLCTSGIAPWGTTLASCLGLTPPDGTPILSKFQGARWESTIATTTIRSQRVMDSRRARKYWSKLKRELTGQKRPDSDRKRLYVSRSRLDTDRRFSNSQAIEDLFLRLGWEVIFPENLSLRTQAELFSAAEIIAGDDGSGLHNCIFAPVGTPMLVLNFNRINLFHATLAQALNHPLAFLNSDRSKIDSGASYTLCTDKLETTISKLCAAVE